MHTTREHARARRLSLRHTPEWYTSMLLSRSRSCPGDLVVPLFVLLAPWSAGGGDREGVALSYVYADSGCVAASWLCVL